MDKKKVVVLGGGNGCAMSLNALKQHSEKYELSAVVSMSDSGGSSGKLRKEFDTLPPGDIMRAVLAMSPHEYLTLKKIFYSNRFDGLGKLDGHNLGNLFLVLGEQYNGDYLLAIRALEQSVEAMGHVYPATLDKTDLVVELNGGEIVRGEDKIDRPDYDLNLQITKAWLEPAGEVLDQAKQAIAEADFIILGPGSLYTSVIAALLVAGVKEAIEHSKAKLIYVSGGAREIKGETGPTKVSGFYSELENYLPRKLDIILYNNHILTDEENNRYIEKGWQRLGFDKENLNQYNIIAVDFERDGGGLCPDRLARVFNEVLN